MRGFQTDLLRVKGLDQDVRDSGGWLDGNLGRKVESGLAFRMKLGGLGIGFLHRWRFANVLIKSFIY